MLLLWLDTLIKWIEERRKQHLLSSSSKKGEKPYPLLNKKSLRLAPNIWEFPFEFSTHFSAFFNWDYLSGSQYNVMAILKLFSQKKLTCSEYGSQNKIWVLVERNSNVNHFMWKNPVINLALPFAYPIWVPKMYSTRCKYVLALHHHAFPTKKPE